MVIRYTSNGQKPTPVLIVKPALRIIKEECEVAKKAQLECSGSLIGFINHQSVVVVYATRTGPGAEQTATSVKTDADFHNLNYKIIRDYYKAIRTKLQYLGEYHLHPFYMPVLSTTDLNTCVEILKNERRDLPGYLVLLVTFNRENIIYKPYSITLEPKTDRSLVLPRALEVIDENSQKIDQMLEGKAYVPLDRLIEDEGKLAASSNPSDLFSIILQTNSYQTTAGKNRIEREFTEIYSKLTCKVDKCITEDNTVYFTVNLENLEILCIFPPEYPLNPPTILYKTERDFIEWIPKYPWNSLSSSFELIKNLIRKVKKNQPERR